MSLLIKVLDGLIARLTREYVRLEKTSKEPTTTTAVAPSESVPHRGDRH
jgi:hypothetical protein